VSAGGPVSRGGGGVAEVKVRGGGWRVGLHRGSTNTCTQTHTHTKHTVEGE
jgi:hypothetical protein